MGDYWGDVGREREVARDDVDEEEKGERGNVAFNNYHETLLDRCDGSVSRGTLRRTTTRRQQASKAKLAFDDHDDAVVGGGEERRIDELRPHWGSRRMVIVLEGRGGGRGKSLSRQTKGYERKPRRERALLELGALRWYGGGGRGDRRGRSSK